MSRPVPSPPHDHEPDRAQLRAVGAPWRVVGIVIVLAAALLLVIGAGVGRRPTEPAMLGAFALLVLGWIMVGVGFYLRRAAARRPRRA